MFSAGWRRAPWWWVDKLYWVRIFFDVQGPSMCVFFNFNFHCVGVLGMNHLFIRVVSDSTCSSTLLLRPSTPKVSRASSPTSSTKPPVSPPFHPPSSQSNSSHQIPSQLPSPTPAYCSKAFSIFIHQAVEATKHLVSTHA
jgi:hypothetical protein